MSCRVFLEASWLTDVGLVRPINEDSLYCDVEKGIFIVADGLGGHRAGEVASSLAVKIIGDLLQNSVLDGTTIVDIQSILSDAILRAHKEIKLKGTSDPRLHGMGTTISIAVVRENEAIIAHCGDSRVYHYRERLRRITIDHTMGTYLVREKGIPENFVPSFYWNILTKSLGADDDPSPDMNIVELEDNDILLLCTDGLTGMISDDEIEREIKIYSSNLRFLAERLVSEAKMRGGHDNITVIVVRYMLRSGRDLWRR
ncbi:MAG: protein phosphatase 2C domain-containing protein [Syntrophales bacterium]|nr:protein phosphatase 2C domain-containing protein [Syntrophales bacterium]